MEFNLFAPSTTLIKAGYKKHWHGYIKPFGKKKSRFHAFVIKDGINGLVHIHYDKDHGTYHSAAPKDCVKGEIKRLKYFYNRT